MNSEKSPERILEKRITGKKIKKILKGIYMGILDGYPSKLRK